MRRLLILLTALALTGCGAAPSSGGATPVPGPDALADAGPVTVTLWHGLGGAPGAALDEQIAAFNAAHAGAITVQAAYQGSYADTLAKYTAALRDGGTPGVLVTNDVTTGFVRDAGQTIPAQDLADANPDDLDLDELRPAARNYYSAEGRLLAVPLATSMPLLYVRDELLDTGGVERSTLGTLDGVAAAARLITARTGVPGLVQPVDGWWFEQLAAAAGQTWCDPGNGREPGGATASGLAAAAPAISTVAALYDEGVGLDTGVEGNAAVSAFAGGQVAMMLNSSGAIGSLRQAGAVAGWSALPYPLSGPAGDSGALIGGAAMWVSGPGHTPAEQLAAWKAVSFLASAAAQEPFTQASGYAPINITVDDSPTEQAFLAENPPYAVLAEQFGATPAVPATAGCLSGAMPGIRSEVVDRMQAVFGGTAEIGPSIADAERAATERITDYREQAGQ